jgi:hypothetical protein
MGVILVGSSHEIPIVSTLYDQYLGNLMDER